MAVDLLGIGALPAHEAQKGDHERALDQDENADFPPQDVGEEPVGLVSEVGGGVERVLRETRRPRAADLEDQEGEGEKGKQTTDGVTPSRHGLPPEDTTESRTRSLGKPAVT